jgi:hypothetical protein
MGKPDTNYNMPAQESYGESMNQALQAQVDMAPDLFYAEADQATGRPAYARLNQNILEESLLGNRAAGQAYWARHGDGGEETSSGSSVSAPAGGWGGETTAWRELERELEAKEKAAWPGVESGADSGAYDAASKALIAHREKRPGGTPEVHSSPGMVSLVAGDRGKQFATGGVDAEGNPIIETRRSGFDVAGNFLGLDTLGKDLQSDAARRQRAEDINAVSELGDKATELYRDQGDIQARLDDATALGEQSVIPAAQIDQQKNALIQLANSQGYDQITSPLSGASEQPAGRQRRAGLMPGAAAQYPSGAAAQAAQAAQAAGKTPTQIPNMGGPGNVVNPSDPALQAAGKTPTQIPEMGGPGSAVTMPAAPAPGTAAPAPGMIGPPAPGMIGPPAPAPRQPSPVEDLDRPTIGFEPWLMGSQQLAPGIDRVADPRPARDTQFFGGIQDVDASQVDSRDINASTVNAQGIGNMDGLRSNLVHGANADLALGGNLSMRERRALEQASRGASSARGRGRDFGAVVDEVGALEGARRQREMERKQFATGIAGQEGQFRQAEMGTNLQGQLANQSSYLQKDLANQRSGLQAAQGNQQAGLQAALANQQADVVGRQQQIATTEANQRADLQSGQMGLQASLANQGTQMGLGQMDMQAQMANQQARQSQDRMRMGALEKDIDRGIATGELNERLRQSGLTADRGYATQLVGLEQATSADPWQSILNRSSGAGVATGQNLYGNAAGNLGAGPSLYNPQAGLGYMQDQYNTMANLELGRMGAESTAYAGTMGMIGSLAGAAGTAAASDRSLKKDISLIGKSTTGTNIYSFRYIDSKHGEGVYQGVMADEVPHASILHPDGYAMVDYEQVDVDFKRLN